ncbi:LytTR family transcriptional regulator DNA-binding domain-containing protein, partial [Acidaminococcus timonensis]|uniref:LytTR family transcriptional regulator DNA-binding domain-containing protein n=1 Tax=Acidaminococcus timonensis TaxID=1871002 RepID=UPI0026EC8B4F
QLERFLFHRVHRSYLVNLRWVKNVWGQELTLRNDKVLPLARHRSRELRERLLEIASRQRY